MLARTTLFLYDFFFFQAEDGIRDLTVTGVQTCALPISSHRERVRSRDEPLARAVVAEQACDRESEGRRRGADRRERDPALLRPRALGDAAAGALGPRGALRRARRHALLARRPP